MNRCTRKLVTATGFVKDVKAIASNGNVGTCSGVAGNCGCTHAEINLLKLMPNPESVKVSLSPCLDCAKALVDAGVKLVVYEEEYRCKDGIYYLQSEGVIVVFKV